MTVTDLHCDRCERLLAGPGAEVLQGPYGVRFVYHPGDPRMSDDSGLFCRDCWATTSERFGPERPMNRCAICDAKVERFTSLHVRGAGEAKSWQLCVAHAAAFLNELSTVQPKLDPATLRFPGPMPESAPLEESAPPAPPI